MSKRQLLLPESPPAGVEHFHTLLSVARKVDAGLYTQGLAELRVVLQNIDDAIDRSLGTKHHTKRRLSEKPYTDEPCPSCGATPKSGPRGSCAECAGGGRSRLSSSGLYKCPCRNRLSR